MNFCNEKLILRPWQIQDAEDLFLQAKNPIIGENAGWPPHKNVLESKEIIEKVFSAENTYAVCLKDNKAIGSISLMVGVSSNLHLPNTEGEIGYWIGQDYWGQGLIPQAVKLLLKDGFERLHLNKIWCAHFEGNERSKRVIEKSGFTFYCVHKDVYWSLTQENKTEYIYILTKQEWEKNNYKIS